ncbi:hypothetical protein P389DRAFT_91035 [Cystobasidium minutum MCA 4210]|uniref:uncharacterized protein n=1 Tax=Cystobasidium minutum MCA 4210 TaxID=1397322 RepID=UPI0034CF34DB|eukprot:jgi/Rhomi1/91035/CE91034_328
MPSTWTIFDPAPSARLVGRVCADTGTFSHVFIAPKKEYTLRELIRGSEVYIDPPKVQERSPELEAILAPIRLAQEQATYASFLSSSSSLLDRPSTHRDAFSLNNTETWDFRTASHPNTTVKQEWDAVRKELSAVANVLASMAAVATAVWWAAGTTALAQKTLMSLFGAIAIAAIEGFLYTRFFQKYRESRSIKKPALKSARAAAPHALTYKQ